MIAFIRLCEAGIQSTTLQRPLTHKSHYCKPWLSCIKKQPFSRCYNATITQLSTPLSCGPVMGPLTSSLTPDSHASSFHSESNCFEISVIVFTVSLEQQGTLVNAALLVGKHVSMPTIAAL